MHTHGANKIAPLLLSVIFECVNNQIKLLALPWLLRKMKNVIDSKHDREHLFTVNQLLLG